MGQKKKENEMKVTMLNYDGEEVTFELNEETAVGELQLLERYLLGVCKSSDRETLDRWHLRAFHEDAEWATAENKWGRKTDEEIEAIGKEYYGD
jgi:hypothetical protein